MKSLTEKNHYNPCFWTAHWSRSYTEQRRRNAHGIRARDAAVFALSVKANKVYQTTCKDVHYDKHLGFAEITMETAERLCRRMHPDKYEDFKRKLRPEDYPVYVDFEELFRGMERMAPYRVLLEVIEKQAITTNDQKANLANFIVWQHLRSHAIMNSIIEMRYDLGHTKFEHLIELKWAMSDTGFMASLMVPLMLSRWRLYHLRQEAFPLCDCPITVRSGRLMLALSPRLLLEIDKTVQEPGCWHRNRIAAETLAEFRRRTIGNTFREIIFGDRAVLEEWRAGPAFQERVRQVREMKSYNALVRAEGELELWRFNALGNQ